MLWIRKLFSILNRSCLTKITKMKKLVLSGLMFFAIITFGFNTLFAQKNEWVNQVIVVNGGKFESGTPTDYVTVQSYNPVTQMTNVFGTIYTQSTQHAVIKDKYLYVAAQDSIVKYDLDTYQRVVAISDSGISKLYMYNNRLIVTKQWPIKRFFVEVLDGTDLSLITRIQNISGDCGEAVAANDSIYVAVNGGYAGTQGKLAVLDPSDWTLKDEINFGGEAKGLINLYNYNGLINGVCRTPAGSTNSGFLLIYDYFTGLANMINYEVTLGEGYGRKDNLLYVNMNNGIGTFNLLDHTIQDTMVIPDPGSMFKVNIASAAIDYVGGNIYYNVGNMITFGRGVIANSAGDSVGSYPTGLNPDAIAIDYRVPVGIESPSENLSVSVYPNPVTEILRVYMPVKAEISAISISDPTGRIFRSGFTPAANGASVDCSDLTPGIYFLNIRTAAGNVTRKFIKQ